MPIDDRDTRVRIEVGASGVVELIWAISSLTWLEGRSSTFPIAEAAAEHPELAAEIRGFWGDSPPSGCCDGLDLIPLADRADALLGEETGPALVERLLAAAVDPPGEIGLRSETPADRELAFERLERLAASPDLRDRYGELLVRVWETVAAPAWEAEGHVRVERALAAMRERVAAGGFQDALPSAHVMRKPQHAALVDRMLAAGARVLVAPTFIGGPYNSYYELPGALLVTVGIDRTRSLEALRSQADAIAARLKALGDGTRILLLAQLAAGPASVSELAEALELSQPTVSVHLAKLRDGGFVRARREGGRTVHRTSWADVDRALQDVRRSLRDICGTEDAERDGGWGW